MEGTDLPDDGNNFILPEEYRNSYIVIDGQNFVFDGQKFESLVVKCQNGVPNWGAELEQRRWPDEKAAELGHAALIDKWEV